MARPIWKGHITFGLVNVPVVLYAAEQRTDISFRLIDSRNSARVQYERVNEETGEEVPWDKIVKGFQHDGDQFVLLSEEELERASEELTRTIDIEQFVELTQIDPIFFDKPYYLVPDKGGQKGYVLLREAMAKSGKVGIAQVVIRTRQHLAALRPEHDALVLTLMRYQQELRDLADYDIPGHDLRQYKISPKEIAMAEQLIETLTDDWQPEKFHDEYHDAVMELIHSKIAAGESQPVDLEDEVDDEEPTTINFMDVLKKSIAKTKPAPRKSTPPKATKKAPPKKTPRKRATRKKTPTKKTARAKQPTKAKKPTKKKAAPRKTTRKKRAS